MSVNLQEFTAECTHDLCNCSVSAPLEDEAYCSDYCRTTTEDGVESENCACGHPQCDSD